MIPVNLGSIIIKLDMERVTEYKYILYMQILLQIS